MGVGSEVYKKITHLFVKCLINVVDIGFYSKTLSAILCSLKLNDLGN